jgi:hypothetical protein
MRIETEIIKTIYAVMTNGHDFISRGLKVNSERQEKESQDIVFQRRVEEERAMIIPTYNIRGKLPEYPRGFEEYRKSKRKRIDLIV